MLRVCVFLGLPYISAAQLRLGACAEGHIDRAVSVLFLLFIAAILFLFQKKRASSRVRVPERTCEDVNPVYGDYSYPDPTAEVEDS